MPKGLPNIYAIGMPKTCGTSLNKWFEDNTQWLILKHDIIDIVWTIHEGSETEKNLLKQNRAQLNLKDQCRTGMMHVHWRDIVAMDPNALFIMTVRDRLDTWAGSFWRHFSRSQLGNNPSGRNKAREILGIIKAPGKKNTLTRIEKPGMVDLLSKYVPDQIEMARWAASNPNACVISLDSGTTPEKLLHWIYGRVASMGSGSALPWSHITKNETDVGRPIYDRTWPHSRKAPEYELPLWIVVECMKWNSDWQSEVLSQIL